METFLPVNSIANISSRQYIFSPANGNLNRTNIKNEFLLMLCEEMLKNSFKFSSSDDENGNKITQDLAVKMAARKLAEQLQEKGFLKGVQP